MIQINDAHSKVELSLRMTVKLEASTGKAATFPANGADCGYARPATVIELDLRHLPAPEPMARILDALSLLGDGMTLLARTPCHPLPLLRHLHAHGYRTDVAVTAAGDAWVHIFADDGRISA